METLLLIFIKGLVDLKILHFPAELFYQGVFKAEEANTIKLFRNNLSDILTNAISNGYLQQNPTDLMVLMDVMAQVILSQ